jgi:hypothetical protein
MLDSGPFEELPCRLLREAGYTLYTFDGSSCGVNYRHSREDGEVQDVELLPAHYQDEDGCILEEYEDDIQTVYVIVFEEDEDEATSSEDNAEARVCGKLSGKLFELSGKLFQLVYVPVVSHRPPPRPKRPTRCACCDSACLPPPTTASVSR